MFRWMNRVYRALWVLAALAIAFLLWQQRGRMRPVIDYYQLWHNVDFNFPKEPERVPVELVRVLSETVVHVRDKDGVLWAVGLQAAEGISGQVLRRSEKARDWSQSVREEITEALEAGSLKVAMVSRNPNRTASGFLYLDEELYLEEMVSRGWVILKPEAARVLPLKQQHALRLADRHSRAQGLGLWSSDNTDFLPPDLP
jgi:hypothetical protein